MRFSSLLVDERDSFVHPVDWRKYTLHFMEGRFVRPAGTNKLDIGLVWTSLCLNERPFVSQRTFNPEVCSI